jgi:L-alanine-DL-glutamate epimerase and related enzymes of enolase superfamily
MKEKEHQLVTGRRDALKMFGLVSAGLVTGGFRNYSSGHQQIQENIQKPLQGLPPVKIKSVKAIGTRPGGSNLVVVKVETTEPGLYGLGCATFTQRAEAVITAINSYMPDFCIGRDVDNIEDMWQAFHVSSYWRNGPVLNNALSGLDQALWDIKGKRANMPVYQLLGGKCRFAIDSYASADAATPEEVAEGVLRFMDQGYRHVRIQQGGYGALKLATKPDFKENGFGMPRDGFMDDQAYLRSVPKMFDFVRKKCGEEIELCHDIHERCQPRDVINLCKNLEQYNPFFIEDPVSPENMNWFKQLRESTNVPFAMGELFNNTNEFLEPIVNHFFDYIRIHVSEIGGITPAMKVARLCEWFNVKTIWHGPGDVSPVGHSAQAHMDLACWNFGIQEGPGNFSDKIREVFPGSPTMKNGYVYVNEVPGLGVDINEKEAAKYPITNNAGNWVVRKRDGTIITP